MHHWRTMIENVQEKDLRSKTILDFGCNQGGFIQMLYHSHPFKKAVGVDIAAASLAQAARINAHLPIDFYPAEDLSLLNDVFDVAFSHEVIYLLPDLNAHAKQMRSVLKDNGVYYAATGCHTDNPAWPAWHKAISEYSNIPVPDYSLDDYAASFANNGFRVEAMQFKSNGFIVAEPDDTVYYPKLIDKLNYYNQHKILFRFSKGA
jgi:SAM-dependent methyltransferase